MKCLSTVLDRYCIIGFTNVTVVSLCVSSVSGQEIWGRLVNVYMKHICVLYQGYIYCSNQILKLTYHFTLLSIIMWYPNLLKVSYYEMYVYIIDRGAFCVYCTCVFVSMCVCVCVYSRAGSNIQYRPSTTSS